MSPDRRRTTALAAAVTLAVGLTACSAADSAADGAGPQELGHARPAPDPAEGYVLEEGVRTGMTDPARDALSTFALDVDTGSYTRFRDATRQGLPVDPGAVRTEEFVNYFAQDYPTPQEGLGVSVDAAELPFRPGHRLVRVGVAGAQTQDEDRPDADLALVVDCSGSMDEAGKMETTKAALRTLVGSLRPTDRVAMVCYSSTAQVVLPPTPASERDGVLAAVDRLRPLDSTNAAAGLEAGYDLAGAMRTDGRMARVVLVSDGVANVGETDPQGILQRIGDEARTGVNLVSVGVGIAGYGDHLLEQLADQGDGWHVYVDTHAEAERVFSTGLTSSLVVAARDARAQVVFDPAQVEGYRLIGYENRAMADEDFRDDTVDGGEVFAGRTTTALYEVAMRGSGEAASREPFVTATVRWLDGSGAALERSASLVRAECATSPREGSPRLHQDLVVALLTDHLVGGPWSQVGGSEVLRAEAGALAATLQHDPDVRELLDLVRRATV